MPAFSIESLEEFKIVKQLKIVSEYSNNREFSIGYILYERPLTNVYRFTEVPEKEKDFSYFFDYPSQNLYPTDNVDEIILQAVKNSFPKSFVWNYQLIFNVDQEKINYLQDRQNTESEIVFTPDFSQIDIYNMHNTSYRGLKKQVKIYNDFRIEDITNLAFNGYYNIKDKKILNQLDLIKFL